MKQITIINSIFSFISIKIPIYINIHILKIQTVRFYVWIHRASIHTSKKTVPIERAYSCKGAELAQMRGDFARE